MTALIPEPAAIPTSPSTNARSLLPKGPWLARSPVVSVLIIATTSVEIDKAII